MSEMDTTTETGEMPTPPTPGGEMPQAQPTGKEPTAELEEIRAALKKANNEAARYRKLADEAAAAQKAKEDAELSEMEKLKRQISEMESRAKANERALLQHKIGAEFGLPDLLIPRLQGEDEDAMREDAKALAATLPKKPSSPALSATNPGNGQPPAETDAQRQRRIYGGNVDIFNPAEAAKLGGGVFWNTPQDAKQ